MCHNKDRFAFIRDISQDREYCIPVVIIQIAGRLVREQDLRIAYQRSGDRHPSHLASGQFPGKCVFQMRDPHPLHQLPGSVRDPVIPSVDRSGKKDVLKDRQRGNRALPLRHDPVMIISESGQSTVIQAVQIRCIIRNNLA